MTTGEGGMICTDNQEIADRCRFMALHGISRDALETYQADGNWFYEVLLPVTNTISRYRSGNGPRSTAKIGIDVAAGESRMPRFSTDAFGEAPELQIPLIPPKSSTPGTCICSD